MTGVWLLSFLLLAGVLLVFLVAIRS
jgi:hypothetical protein